jgi:hypothetical protein
MTRNKLKEIKSVAGSKLVKKVINVILSKGDNEDIEDFMKNTLQHGCISGTVSELIYYSDTVEFYQKYKKEINDLLLETMDQLGANSPSEVFGDKWETEDYFAEDTNNQNLLAWFGFEETVRTLAEEIEVSY